jgi:hypothetical protein
VHGASVISACAYADGIAVVIVVCRLDHHEMEQPSCKTRRDKYWFAPACSQLGRFVSADSRSVLRYNGAASSVILLPVDLPIRSWPVAIVTLKGRTINPVVQTFVDCVRDVSKAIGNTKLRCRKFKNPEAPAVKREAEEDWGR